MVHFMGGTYLGTPFKHLPYHLVNTHSLLVMVTIIATIEGTLSIWKVNHLKHQSTMQVLKYLLSKIHQNLIKTEQSYNISLWCVQHLRKDSFLKVFIIRHLFYILDLFIMVFSNLDHQIEQSVMRLCI
jgi:hypothetical protein